MPSVYRSFSFCEERCQGLYEMAYYYLLSEIGAGQNRCDGPLPKNRQVAGNVPRATKATLNIDTRFTATRLLINSACSDTRSARSAATRPAPLHHPTPSRFHVLYVICIVSWVERPPVIIGGSNK